MGSYQETRQERGAQHMPRHASKDMQRIRRIGHTLYIMDNIVWNHLDEPLTREEIAEVISATPQERHAACYHVGLTKEDADELSSTAEQTVREFEDAKFVSEIVEP